MNERESEARKATGFSQQVPVGPLAFRDAQKGGGGAVRAHPDPPLEFASWRPVITEGWMTDCQQSQLREHRTDWGKEIILSPFPSPQTSKCLLNLPVMST